GGRSSASRTPYVGLASNLRIGDYAGRISQMTQSVALRTRYNNPSVNRKRCGTILRLYGERESRRFRTGSSGQPGNDQTKWALSNAVKDFRPTFACCVS